MRAHSPPPTPPSLSLSLHTTQHKPANQHIPGNHSHKCCQRPCKGWRGWSTGCLAHRTGAPHSRGGDPQRPPPPAKHTRNHERGSPRGKLGCPLHFKRSFPLVEGPQVNTARASTRTVAWLTQGRDDSASSQAIRFPPGVTLSSPILRSTHPHKHDCNGKLEPRSYRDIDLNLDTRRGSGCCSSCPHTRGPYGIPSSCSSR